MHTYMCFGQKTFYGRTKTKQQQSNFILVLKVQNELTNIQSATDSKEGFKCILTLVSPAMAIILLNMVLQTKYEAMQEIVPSVPDTEKEILIRNDLFPPSSIHAESVRKKHKKYKCQKKEPKKKKVQAHFQKEEVTTKLYSHLADWKHLVDAIIIRFFNHPHV